MAGDISRENGRKSKNGGRPRLEATKLREALIRKAEAHAEELADSIIGKALGLEAHRSADVQAHREILDRGLGKPQLSVDHTTNGESLHVNVIQYAALSEEKPTDNENGDNNSLPISA